MQLSDLGLYFEVTQTGAQICSLREDVYLARQIYVL
jgi:hypothetical protein